MAKSKRLDLILFFILMATVALGNGLSDTVYNNYYKEVYDVTTAQRSFIEFPRELPGVLCFAVIGVLSSLGDLRMMLISQVLSMAGMTLLGFWTPSFGVMLSFLFTASLGMHMFFPLQDSVGMSVAEPGKVGKRLGQFASVRSAMTFTAAGFVYIGFRTGFLSFARPVKGIFLYAAGAYALAFICCLVIIMRLKPQRAEKKKIKLIFRKEYIRYYLLTILHGVQKQIAYVYGTWVIVDILLKGADTMALLSIVSSFICIFFMQAVGRWVDRHGYKRMMVVESICFVAVYLLLGLTVLGFTGEFLPINSLSCFLVYFIYILDKLSMQFGMVKAVYLRDIAKGDSDITATLSTGTSLDHVVSISAALLGGAVWTALGAYWVFFMAAGFSALNLLVVRGIKTKKAA